MADNNIPASSSGYAGYLLPDSVTSEFNKHVFLIQQLMALNSTMTLVQIVSCTNTDTASAVGSVDVQPLVNMLDGSNNSTPHGVVHGLPYFRLQGGTQGAIIADPKVGDIGLAVFADRDISGVKATKAQANPGSGRRFNMADGVYLGGLLNGVPTQFVRFFAGGIEIADKNSNTIEMASAGITINGVLFDRSQNVTNVAQLTTGDITHLAGGAKKVVLDGDTVVGGHVVASSTKTTAT